MRRAAAFPKSLSKESSPNFPQGPELPAEIEDSGMISAGASRGNGKQPSCEPCRKGKIRCDHQRPVCARCRRRGLVSRCWYHPAPLTKSRIPATATATATDADSFALFPDSHSLGARSSISTSSNGSSTTTQATAATSISGGQALAFLPWPSVGPDADAPESPLPRLGAIDETIHDEQLDCVAELLTHLRHFTLIERLLHEYYAVSQAALVPGPFILSAVSALRNSLSSLSPQLLDNIHDNEGRLSQLAESVLRSTSTNIDITSSLGIPSFCAMYNGESLRLETVGLIYSIAARSCTLGLGRDDEKREDFVQAMFRCSTTCLRLVRDIAPQINDATVWLAYENLLLTMSIHGDASPNVWRRLSDLAADLFALGIHRESTNTSKTPLFLAECRRKTFAAAYQLDKFIATFFDRPPRISRRYSDCKMPLDLADDELFADPPEFEQARLSLTSEGWNAEGKYFSSTWARLRYILAVFREEVLEYPFRPLTSENITKLKDLSNRCHQTWESLPAHLRYTPSCWSSGLPATVCLMLTVVHLSYLQSEFKIHRLLQKSDPDSSSTLMKVSADIVATVLQLGSSRDRAVFLPHDFPYIVLNYGLPSAALLATALQGMVRSGARTLPANLSRSTLIRSLSVFISHLESIYCPGEATHLICVQASKAISRTLDDVLDAPAVPVAMPRSPTPASTNNNIRATLDSPTQPLMLGTDTTGMTHLDILNSDELDGLDLSSWVKNIDWTGTGGEWSTF